MITIVFAHPWHGSFNKAILDAITTKLDKENKAYEVIDLNKDNFNPVLTEADLAQYSKGDSPDPLVTKYQDILRKTSEVVFIFPIWWHTMPAILKGFFDKVMLVNFSHNYEGGWNPLLGINKASVITTSESPTERFRSSIEGEMYTGMLASVGISNAKWYNHDGTAHGSNDAERKAFLKEIEDLF